MLFSPETKLYAIDEPVLIPDAGDKLVVLVHSVLAPDVMAFLEKMIAAFGWNPDQCHHLDYIVGKNENYSMLWRSTGLKLVVSFGISPELIGLYSTSRPYQVIEMGTFIMYQCDPLEKLANNKELKGRIWKDLKDLYSTDFRIIRGQ